MFPWFMTPTLIVLRLTKRYLFGFHVRPFDVIVSLSLARLTGIGKPGLALHLNSGERRRNGTLIY